MITRNKFLTLLAAALLVPAAGAFAKAAPKPAKAGKVEKAEGHHHEHGKEGKEEGGECHKHDGGCCKGHCGKMGMMDATTVAIVKHKVKDYDIWRKAFDADGDMKEKGGIVMAHVLQSATDPTDVTVIARFKDEATAKAFTTSPELKAAMEKSGVIGEPQVTILKDVTGAMCARHGKDDDGDEHGECHKHHGEGMDKGMMGEGKECPRHKEMMEKGMMDKMDKGGDKAPESKSEAKPEPKKDEKKTDKK